MEQLGARSSVYWFNNAGVCDKAGVNAPHAVEWRQSGGYG